MTDHRPTDEERAWLEHVSHDECTHCVTAERERIVGIIEELICAAVTDVGSLRNEAFMDVLGVLRAASREQERDPALDGEVYPVVGFDVQNDA